MNDYASFRGEIFAYCRKNFIFENLKKAKKVLHVRSAENAIKI